MPVVVNVAQLMLVLPTPIVLFAYTLLDVVLPVTVTSPLATTALLLITTTFATPFELNVMFALARILMLLLPFARVVVDGVLKYICPLP